MQVNSIRILLVLTIAVFGLALTWTARAAAPSNGAFMGKERGGGTGAVASPGVGLRCRSKFEDHIAVCCRFKRGARYYDKLTARKDCTGPYKTIVSRSNCPRRSRELGSSQWVCCETDTTPGLGPRLVGKSIKRALLPAADCRKRPRSTIVSRSKCVKKRTRRDRMIECKKRGKDWVWKDNRCQRSAVRDKRGR